MKKLSNAKGRVALGRVSQATQGGVRGVIEPFGLYTPSIRLD
jgi:hypothetical protein